MSRGMASSQFVGYCNMDENDLGADDVSSDDDDPSLNFAGILYYADTHARDMIQTKIKNFQEQLKRLDSAHCDASKELETRMKYFFMKMKTWEAEFHKELDQHFHTAKSELKEELIDIKKLEGSLIRKVLDTKVALAANSENPPADMSQLYFKGYNLANIIVDIFKVKAKGIQSMKFKANRFQRQHLGVMEPCELEDGPEAHVLNYLEGFYSGADPREMEKDNQLKPKKFDVEVEELNTEQKELGYKRKDLSKGGIEQLPGPSVSDQVEESKTSSPKKCIGMRKLLTSHRPLRRPQCARLIESEAQAPSEHEIPAVRMPEMNVNKEERKSSDTDQQLEHNGFELEFSHTVGPNKTLMCTQASIVPVYKTCESDSLHSQLCYPGTPISHVFIPGVCKHVGESKSLKMSHLGITSVLNKISKNNELLTQVVPKETCTRDVLEGSPYLDFPTFYRKAKLVFKTSLPQSRLNKPIGVVQLSSREIVVADTFNDRMVMFDERGEFIKTFKVDVGLQSPSAVVQLTDGRIAVKDSICIHLFDCDGNFFSTIGNRYMQKPYGLTVDDEGNLLTLEARSQGYIIILTICPQMGIVASKVKVNLNIEPQLVALSKPRFMMWYQKDKVLVVNLGLNCVYVINYKSGMVVNEFGELGYGDGQFSDPAGISCDSLGNVYIADSRNHRIQVFDSNLNFTCVLLTDSQLVRPSGIFISPKDDLFVVNYWEDSMAKFSLTSKASGRMRSDDMM